MRTVIVKERENGRFVVSMIGPSPMNAWQPVQEHQLNALDIVHVMEDLVPDLLIQHKLVSGGNNSVDVPSSTRGCDLFVELMDEHILADARLDVLE